MSLQYAKNPYTVHWKEWLKRRFFTDEMRLMSSPSLATQLVDTLLETYEVDGIDISEGEYTPAPDFEYGENYNPLKVQIYAGLISFLGFPNRLTRFYVNGQPFEGITLTQLGKNLIGGWDSRPNISLQKKILQWIALIFIKIPIILPIKLVMIPLKFILNCVKVFTEFLPLLISSLSAQSMGWFIREWQREGSDNSLRIAGLSLGIVLLGTLHYSFRIITLAGRALTSPAKNVRMALAYGRELKGKKFLSNILGGVAALLSITLTATLWIFTLPLAISAISTYIPMLVQAFTWVLQLPIVVTMSTFLSQMPLLKASFSSLHSTLTTLGLGLNAVFSPVITALGSLIGVEISLGLIVATSALSVIAAPFSVILSIISDKLSNRWASWKTVSSNPKTEQSKEKADEFPLTPSENLISLVEKNRTTTNSAVTAATTPDAQLETIRLLSRKNPCKTTNPKSVEFDPKRITVKEVVRKVEDWVADTNNLCWRTEIRRVNVLHPFYLRQYNDFEALQLSMESHREKLRQLSRFYQNWVQEISRLDEGSIDIQACITTLIQLNSEVESIRMPTVEPIKDADTLSATIANHKKDIDIIDDAGCTLLIYYAMMNKINLVRILLQNGANINAQSDPLGYDHGNTALHWAIANASLPLAMFMIQNYGNIIDYSLLGYGQTVLSLAIAKGPFHVHENSDGYKLNQKSSEVFRVIINALIGAGATVNTQDERHGFSPLHLAVLHRDVELVDTLLKRGARQDYLDKENRTAVDLLKLEPDQIRVILRNQCSAFTLNTDDWARRGEELYKLLHMGTRHDLGVKNTNILC